MIRGQTTSEVKWYGGRRKSANDLRGRFLGKASPEEHAYFRDYIERYADKGADIYLLEYTRDSRLIREIRMICKDDHGGI